MSGFFLHAAQWAFVTFAYVGAWFYSALVVSFFTKFAAAGKDSDDRSLYAEGLSQFAWKAALAIVIALAATGWALK